MATFAVILESPTNDYFRSKDVFVTIEDETIYGPHTGTDAFRPLTATHYRKARQSPQFLSLNTGHIEVRWNEVKRQKPMLLSMPTPMYTPVVIGQRSIRDTLSIETVGFSLSKSTLVDLAEQIVVAHAAVRTAHAEAGRGVFAFVRFVPAQVERVHYSCADDCRGSFALVVREESYVIMP